MSLLSLSLGTPMKIICSIIYQQEKNKTYGRSFEKACDLELIDPQSYV